MANQSCTRRRDRKVSAPLISIKLSKLEHPCRRETKRSTYGQPKHNSIHSEAGCHIGAGFAGLSCALKLASDADLRITLIDKNNYQQFQPLLYQVATGILSPDNAAFNLRDVFLHHENIQVVTTEIETVDLSRERPRGKKATRFRATTLCSRWELKPTFRDTRRR